MITILGPTATGKTGLSVALAQAINGEIISADSRQVYRGMDIGTGKDLSEYQINGINIPYHLIDLYDPGYEYNVFEFQNDFLKAYDQITNNNREAILCGGTGMYIDSILKGYKLIPVPKNEALQAELDLKEHEELIQQLQSLTTVHNTTDFTSKKRTIRAIELELYCQENQIEQTPFPKIPNVTFGIHWDRDIIKKRITTRLKERLDEGMIDEVKGLLKKGITAEALKFYGLEYKFITQHIEGELSYNDMYQKLNTAIHQFAKKQMTWFRRMEKQGTEIHWIDGSLPNTDKINFIQSKLPTSLG